MRLIGTPGAPGIAIGPVWRYRAHDDATTTGPQSADADAPVDPVAVAATAAAQLQRIADRLRGTGQTHEAEIFEAQAMMATDPTLVGEWQDRIVAGATPLAALRAATMAIAEMLAAIPDEVLAARAADIRDVGERMERVATGADLDLPTEPSIVVARDLPPSTAAEIPADVLLGIALEAGSRTAHAAILARGLGIPCVVSARGLLDVVDADLAAANGTPTAAIDGASGLVLLRPDDDELAEISRRRLESSRRGDLVRGFRDRPAQTRDGQRVTLLANIGGPADSARALDARAEGVGLFRTEFLFMGRQGPPSEEEQVAAYGEVFRAFGPHRPVVVRLADIGGDKDIPYLRLPREENPFLGVRGIWLCHRDPGLYLTQIRAVSRAAAAADVEPHLMAPMVATLADVVLLHDLVRTAQAQLGAEGVPGAPRIVTGIMVEVPSAALLATELAEQVDFFSLGTNDLTQYLLAADRTNRDLADLQDGLHPAVLRAIRLVTSAAAAAGKPVAVCGELAGDPLAALVLVGLGVNELSADAGSLDELRYQLARVTSDELLRLGSRALAARDAAEVRALAREVGDSDLA